MTLPSRVPDERLRLSAEQLADLRWLSKQPGLVWGGAFRRVPAALRSLIRLGLIDRVVEPYTAGKLTFPGGYRITKAGRELLEGRGKATNG